MTYTLLGLGDLAIPGIALVFLLRFDKKREKLYKGYFFTGYIGYCFGLLFAFIASSSGFEINGVRGQPALLYIVPLMLIPVFIVAKMRGDVQILWKGRIFNIIKIAHFSPKASESLSDDITEGTFLLKRPDI